MSADSTAAPGADDLQFDRAVDSSAASGGSVVCSKCNAPIRMYYYHVDGETACSTCKGSIERARGGPGKSGPGMLKAVLYGLGAAIAGAMIYYAVMEYLDLEIGVVAILIGFMVGYAIRNATAGQGGRKFQILAAGLTYFAVALAYAPFSLRGGTESGQESAVADSTGADSEELALAATDVDADVLDEETAVDSEAAAAAPTSETSAEPEQLGAAQVALGVGGGLLFVLLLPIVVIIGSMPSGLISALIIGIGIRQAWTMTAGGHMLITGPFKVGSEPSPAPA